MEVRKLKDFDILHQDETFRYRLLSRMKMDCNFYLGFGEQSEKCLWSGTVEKQIADMKALWNSFPDDKKPEWLSFAQILEYEKQMKEV